MKVVDPHIHLWDLSKVRMDWLATAGEAYSGDNTLLPKPFTPTELLAGAEGIEILKVVNVEANPNDFASETAWLQSLADETGYPQGIVAMADFSQPDTQAVLEAHKQYRNLRGIRQILNVHSDKHFDYVGRQFMAEPTWRQNFKLLAKYDLSFDLQIYPSQMALAAEVIRENPETLFIINHAGMFVDRNTVQGWTEWRDGMRLLAQFPNVVVKISGLAMFDHQWTVNSFRPLVLETIATFGVQRCMFASNFPIDGLHSGYAALWHAYAEVVSGASESERHALFVGNAERYYRI